MGSIIANFQESGDGDVIARLTNHPLLTDNDMASRDIDADFDAALQKLHEDTVAAAKRAEIDRRAREMGLG